MKQLWAQKTFGSNQSYLWFQSFQYQKFFKASFLNLLNSCYCGVWCNSDLSKTYRFDETKDERRSIIALQFLQKNF